MPSPFRRAPPVLSSFARDSAVAGVFVPSSPTAACVCYLFRVTGVCNVRRQTPMDVKSGATKAEDVNFPLRWGIIGASRISSDWIKCLGDVPGASLAAVAARDMGRAQEYADAHGIPTAYDSYVTLVSDPEVNIVYIGTKTDDHHAHTMLAIDAGKHVVCEKPFCATEVQAAECFAAAAAKGVFLQEGMWTRFFPIVEHARQIIADGAIGRVITVKSDFPDICYALTPATMVFGPDKLPAVTAKGSPGMSGIAVLEYGPGDDGKPGDRLGVCSFTSWAEKFPETTEFIGTQGRITLHSPAHCPTTMTISAPQGETTVHYPLL